MQSYLLKVFGWKNLYAIGQQGGYFGVSFGDEDLFELIFDGALNNRYDAAYGANFAV